ncbi:MAG: methyltransferase regulatory domain-containing protein [Deltaproteobacteria bacterium]|nr:methyltransferase regulatory domain-containing protein [Deltaproteobacteria bacterium]
MQSAPVTSPSSEGLPEAALPSPPPWPGPALPCAHPDRMGLFGALHGLATADVRGARVLEIGCREGNNLLPLAATWPGASFVGLEADPALAVAAAERARAAGLGNVSILGGGVAAFASPGAPELGAFDYVVAHGVLARLPEAERGALWGLIRRALAPHGMALVTFDTWPGHHVLEPIRRLMRYHTEAIPDPEARIQQARAIARFHVRRWHQVHGPTRGVLQQRLLGELDALSDAELERELLGPEVHPAFFEDAVAEAAAHELTWVANARASEPRLRWMPSSIRAFLAGVDDMARQQQYMDFFVDQRFRTSLFCRADAPLRRQAHVDEFMGLFVAPRPDVDAADEAMRPRAPASPRPSSQALWLLERVVAPLTRPTRADELVARAVAEGFPGQPFEAKVAVTELFFADLIELARTPAPVLARRLEADTRPLATSLARLAASQGAVSVTSLWHRDVLLLEVERQALARCDGATTADVIVEAVGPDGGDALEALQRHGFLCEPGA